MNMLSLHLLTHGFLDLSMIFFQNLFPSSSSGDGIEWRRTTPYKLSNLFVFFSHLCSFPSSLSLSKTAMTQQTYHKCFIMFYCEMFGCSGLHCFLFTGAASLPQLWLGSPASGFKRLAAKQAVGRDHQAALWLLPLWWWWLLRWFLHFPGWYSQCLVAGRTSLIVCTCLHLVQRLRHVASATHVNQVQSASVILEYRHTDGSPWHNREWRSASLQLWQSWASCCSSERCSRAGCLGTGIERIVYQI